MGAIVLKAPHPRSQYAGSRSQASLDDQFAEMVQGTPMGEHLVMGSSNLCPARGKSSVVRKSLVAALPIRAGELSPRPTSLSSARHRHFTYAVG